MGLDAVVGVFAELDLDGEGIVSMRDEFARLNLALKAAALPEHIEPEDLPLNQTWSARIGGYSSIHYLRRVAAHIWAGRSVPEPIEDATDDALLRQLYNSSLVDTRPAWKRWFSPPTFPGNTFAHVVHHSDAEGFYLPIDFAFPLVPDPELKVPGAIVGSSLRLLRECEQLAEALALPTDLDPESSDFDELLVDPPREGPVWRRQAVASYVCLQLLAGCRASIRTGAAIVFC